MEGSITEENDTLDRDWAELLPEILSLIADRLGLVELLGFRGVCKGWRYASSTASAKSESAKGAEPGFLVYGPSSDQKCKFIYRGSKMYRLSIPELDEAICLASDQGWLLLARHQEQKQEQASLFFFCPFSRARIELPEFPRSELSDHVASFSAPPTSPNCILAVAHLSNKTRIELHRLHRGASTWTSEEFNISKMGTLSGAYYHNRKGCFYFTDNHDRVLKVSTKEQQLNLKSYLVLPTYIPDVKILPFRYRKQSVWYSNMKDKTGLPDDISLCTTGTSFLMADKNVMVINSEKLEPSSPHIAEGMANVLQLKGIWIHPRFHQIPPNQCW